VSGRRVSGRASVSGSAGTSARLASAAPASVGRARVGGGGGGRPPVPGRPSGNNYRGRPRPRWGRIALVLGVAFGLVVLLGGFGVYLYAQNLDGQVQRTDAFAGVTGSRPPVVAPGAMNILLLGSDSRDPASKANGGQWRTDTIILMHVQADHKHAYLISIPRDTYVYIPKSPTNPDQGDTNDKINSAFAWGGVPLVVQTVEGFTGVHVDHVAIIDFGGFQEVTDALGGVDMYVDQTIKSIHPPYRTFTKGNQHFTGAEALDYVRQRYQFADGDITREKHQQVFLKAVMDKAASSGTLTSPGKLTSFLDAVTKALTVDKQFPSLAGLAWEFHSLGSKDLTFMTSPIAGFPTINGQSVVKSDSAKASALYDAVAHDTLARYLNQGASPATSTGG
jgi:LCP family protein required for cell wall assembly